MYTTPGTFIVRATSRGHVVSVAGEIDLANACEFAETLGQFPNGDVSVDLSDVEFFDSSGLNALLAAHRHISRRGAELRVQRVPSNVMKIFELTGLDEVLHIDASPSHRV